MRAGENTYNLNFKDHVLTISDHQMLHSLSIDSTITVQSHLKFSKIQGGSEPHVQNLFKLCQKLHLILLIKIL